MRLDRGVFQSWSGCPSYRIACTVVAVTGHTSQRQCWREPAYIGQFSARCSLTADVVIDLTGPAGHRQRPFLALEDSMPAILGVATGQGAVVQCLPGTAAAIAQTHDSPVMSSEASSPASPPPSSNSLVHFLRRFGRPQRNGPADPGADANELPLELQASDALLGTSDSANDSDGGGSTTVEDDATVGTGMQAPRSRIVHDVYLRPCGTISSRRDDSALLAGVKHGQCWVQPPVP